MKTTGGLTLVITKHARSQMVAKGFDEAIVKGVFATPERVYPSGSHPGQFRITGNGVCLVGKPKEGKFILITLYADGVLTPPRPDQMWTEEGRRYADRYFSGKGRG